MIRKISTRLTAFCTLYACTLTIASAETSASQHAFNTAKTQFLERLENTEKPICQSSDIPCLNQKLEARYDIYNLVRKAEEVKGDCFSGLGFLIGEQCKTIMEQIDPLNRRFLDQVIETHGFPSGGHWSQISTIFAFLMIDHKDWLLNSEDADMDRRASFLPAFKRAVEDDILPGILYAITADRVSFHKDGTQIYGTKHICVDGTTTFKGLPPADQLNANRAELGMPPFSKQDSLITGTCTDG